MQSSLRLGVLALTLALGLFAGGCSSSTEERRADVAVLVAKGKYARALRLAERNAREEPESEKAQQILKQAQIAYLLDDARQTLFEGNAAGALNLVELAEGIDAGDPTVAMWRLKIQRQLAVEWLDAANDLYASGEVENALDAYERALGFDPDSFQAKLGIARALLTLNYRQGRSKSYYNEALEAFRGYLLPQADNSFAKSLVYDEGNVSAEERRKDVKQLLLDERMEVARDFEHQKLYFAARNEYRIALLIDPKNPLARDGFDRMDRESRVRRSLDEAEMDVRRGELDSAGEVLDQNEPLTEKQTDEVMTMRNQIADAGIEAMYKRALDLERDYRYDEAIAAYDDLLAETEGPYADAEARRASLIDFRERAAALYAQFESADNDFDRLRYLREIEVFWPEYRDVAQQMAGFNKRASEIFQAAQSAATPEEARELLEELQVWWPSYPGLAEWLERLNGG